MNKSTLIERFTCNMAGRNHNCKVIIEGNKSILRLHSTDIVIVEDSKMYFNTKNWKTATTKSYMNKVLSAVSTHGISQIKGEWFFNRSIPFECVDYLDLNSGLLVTKEGQVTCESCGKIYDYCDEPAEVREGCTHICTECWNRPE